MIICRSHDNSSHSDWHFTGNKIRLNNILYIAVCLKGSDSKGSGVVFSSEGCSSEAQRKFLVDTSNISSTPIINDLWGDGRLRYMQCAIRQVSCVQAVFSYDCGLWYRAWWVTVWWCVHSKCKESWSHDANYFKWLTLHHQITAFAAACLHWSSSARPQHTLNLCLNDAELIDLRWQSTFFSF